MPPEYTAEECARLRAEGLMWREIGEMFGVKEDAPRKLVARAEIEKPVIESITGYKPADEWPDPLDVLAKQQRAYEQENHKQAKRSAQRIAISHAPVGLAFLADQHFGAKGCNAQLAIEHAKLVRDTPGLYAFLAGDLVDSFVLQKYLQLRHNAPLGIVEEWALVKYYLDIISPKLLAILDGNHDRWVEILSGLPIMADFVAQIKSDVLYDKYEIMARLIIEGTEEWVLKMRHDWAGHSQWNDYHGIMKAAKMDRPFHIGVGAHDHRGAMAATFRVSFNEARIETAAAVKCGTYKRFDRYQRERGFPLTSPKIAPVVVLQTEPRNLLAFDEITVAADYLKALYGEP